MDTLSFRFAVAVIALSGQAVAIHCNVGYGESPPVCPLSADTLTPNMSSGQRGLKRDAGFSWPRECPSSYYCWEAVTTDIDIMKTFFDFAWDDYYNEYYVHACGGEYGTDAYKDPLEFYRGGDGKLVSRKELPGQVYRVNVTAPTTITGRGGTAEMDLRYVCTGNFCSSAINTLAGSAVVFAIALSVVTTATGVL